METAHITQALKEKIFLFIARLTPEERGALANWFERIISIKNSTKGKARKTGMLFGALKSSKPIFPLIREMASITKEVGWDNRKGGVRAFIGGAGIGILLFGFQGAGLAALGGAIGFPLWVVFGGGGTLAYTILNELRKEDES